MERDNLDLPVTAEAARVFFGVRAAALAPHSLDNAEAKSEKRNRFFHELGHTFMPGTPLMQAPLALSAYIPAVIDPPENSALPDEVAIIVYASREIYASFRETSLSRRMYTRSHTAVFDMDRSTAVFPDPVASPAKGEFEGKPAYFAFSSNAATDWQSGYTRVLLIAPETTFHGFAQDILSRVAAARDAADEWSVDQIVVGVTDSFAALWVHSTSSLSAPAEQLDLVPTGATVMRDLDAQPAMVTGDKEEGETISGACAFTFRFSRFLEFFQ